MLTNKNPVPYYVASKKMKKPPTNREFLITFKIENYDLFGHLIADLYYNLNNRSYEICHELPCSKIISETSFLEKNIDKENILVSLETNTNIGTKIANVIHKTIESHMNRC